MSKDLNKCIFIGRLGKDPEVSYTPAGTAIANFSLACGDDYKDKQTGQKVERTEWVNMVAFNRLAEIISEYVAKGSRICVEGKFHTEKWQDQGGNTRYSTKIIVNEMQMLDSANTGGQPAQQYQQPQQQQRPNQNQGANRADANQSAPPPYDAFDDDIPF